MGEDWIAGIDLEREAKVLDAVYGEDSGSSTARKSVAELPERFVWSTDDLVLGGGDDA